MRYKKYFTVKEWKRFDQWAERIDGNDITAQEIMLQKYDIILTDWKTKREKFVDGCKSADRIGTKMVKGFINFSASLNKPTKRKRVRKNNRR